MMSAVLRGGMPRHGSPLHKKLAVACVTLFCFAAGAADQTEYFVSKDGGNDDYDGLAEIWDGIHGPKQTIQAACDDAASGDMVTVLPGEYDEGGKTAYGCDARVFVEKPLYIRSRDGKEKTHIVGRFHSAENPLGTDAVRCVAFKQGDLGGAVLQGFTLRNGATHCDESSKDISNNQGGGIYHDLPVRFYKKGPMTVDCVISNCVATRGGGTYRGGLFVRCRITDCRATNNGAALREASLVNCVVDNCDSSTSIQPLYACLGAVNCTLVNCGSSSGNNTRPCLNTILLYSSNNGLAASTQWTYTNCYVVASSCGGANNVCTTMLPSPIAAAPLDDFRLVKGTRAEGAGDVTLLNYVPDVPSTVPASVCDRDDYRAKDYFGKPRTTNGTVAIGAAEEAVKMAGVVRVQQLNSADGHLFVNDRPIAVGMGRTNNVNYAYYWYERHPTIYKVTYTAAEGKALYNFEPSPGRRGQPNLRGEYWLLPRSSATDTSLIVNFARVFYANPTADAASADGTSAHPFRRLQDAYDFVTAHYNTTNVVVLCAEGDYNEGTGDFGGHNRLMLRGGQRMTFRAAGDRDKTFITGASDPSEAAVNGCGPDAVRCVAMVSGDGNVLTVHGFTLRNGRSAHADTGDSVGCGGGAMCNGGYGTFTVSDCVITNCVASRGGAFIGGGTGNSALTRTKVVDCGVAKSTGNAIARSGVFDNCLFTGNRGTFDPIGMATESYFCTVAGNSDRPTSNVYASTDGLKVVGSVFETIVNVATRPTYKGSLAWDYTGTFPVSGVLSADPLFVNRETGDYRLLAASPALGLSPVEDLTPCSAMDIDGNPYRLTAEGRATAGCYQTPLRCLVGISDAVGGISPSGPVVFEFGQTITFTATAPETRRFDGFSVNGVLVPGSAKSRTFDYVPSADDPALVEIRAEYNTTWYVSPTGSDSSDGWTHETAKGTLVGVMALARSGDTVLALPGTYADGSMIQETPIVACTPTLRSRVVVPEGVRLVSRDGAAATVIVGEAGTGTDGMGEGAMRCVFLCAHSELEGFTIRDGHTDSVNVEDDNNNGGGVLADSTATVRDCVIRDCTSPRGAGSRNGRYVRCRFENNRSTVNSGNTRNSYAWGCYFGPSDDADNGGANFMYLLDACTMAGSVQLSGIGKAVNTLICGNFVGGNEGCQYVHCLIRQGISQGSAIKLSDCSFSANVALDENGVPVLDANDAIDFADESLSDLETLGVTDARGMPRVLNGRMDAAAYEADWRVRYARDLARSHRLSVAEVDPTVVEDDGAVLLAQGSLTAVYRAPVDCEGRMVLEVLGAGTLTVRQNGTVLVTYSAADSYVLPLTLVAGENELVFSYEPSGASDAGARLISFKADLGGALIIR